MNPAADGVPIPEPDPTIHHSITPWTNTRGPGEHPQYGGWGGAEADRAPFAKLLRVGGTAFDTGIGVLANSRLEVRNQGFSRFTAKVGVNNSGSRQAGKIVFELWGDGRLLAKSKPMAFGEPAAPLEAQVSRATILELVARGDAASSGTSAVQPAVWADAALLR